MLTIFNRRRLCQTNSMEEYARVRDVLQGEKIEYSINTISQYGSSLLGTNRSRGSYGVNQNETLQYVFYVNKKDFDEAKFIINR